MIKSKRTLRQWYYCPIPNKSSNFQQRGMILIWVLFLLLIISSSSLALAKHSYAQLNLVSYYDDYFQQEREVRAIEREITGLLKGGGSSKNTCLVVASEMQPCDLLASDQGAWAVVGRKITEKEYESINIEWSGKGDILLFEIRNVQDVFPLRRLIYQISKSERMEGKESSNEALQVQRKLLWASN